MNRNLTNTNSVAILCLPCNSEVGFRSLFRKGDISPQSLQAVFLRQKFTHLTNLFSELSNVMVVLFGQPFWLVLPFRDTANPLNTAANFFAVLRDGFTNLQRKGTTDDKIKSSNRANSRYLKQKTTD